MGMEFRGHVWKRVWKMTLFWSEKGSRFGEPRGTSPPRIPRSTPAPLVSFAAVIRVVTRHKRQKTKVKKMYRNNYLLAEYAVKHSRSHSTPSPIKPSWHSHVKEPGTFWHFDVRAHFLGSLHSLISVKMTRKAAKNPYLLISHLSR